MEATLLCIDGAEADNRNLRIAMEDRWHGVIAGMHTLLEQQMPDDKTCLPCGDVRELRCARCVSYRIDSIVSGFQTGIDLDSVRVHADTRIREIKTVHIRCATS